MNWIGFIMVQICIVLPVMLGVVFSIWAGILHIGKWLFDEKFHASSAETAETLYSMVSFGIAVFIGAYICHFATTQWTIPYFFK